MVDLLGRPILVGDTVAYPNRRGSRTEICTGTFLGHGKCRFSFPHAPDGDCPVPARIRKPSGRMVLVERTDRLVVCRRAELPAD